MSATESPKKRSNGRPAEGAAVPVDLDRYPTLGGYLVSEASAKTLADEVYDQILIRIIRSELPSNTELKSTQIAAEMNVSRTPVVQALGRLQSDGIVTQQTNYRALVRPGAENWLVDIHHLRQQLEPAAARSAAGAVPESVIADLRRLAEDTRKCTGERWRKATRYVDYALHLAIAEFCGNLAVGESIRKCWMYKRLSYDAVHDSDEALQREYREHLEILDYLSTGAGETAFEAMQNHLHEAAAYRMHQRIV